MEAYQESVRVKPHPIGLRKCLVCGRRHRPKTENQKRCGSCEARHQAWLAERGLAR